MIEADVLLRGQDPKVPIMAHPPDNDSDITLQDWLKEVVKSDKGIKLDFKRWLNFFTLHSTIFFNFNNAHVDTSHACVDFSHTVFAADEWVSDQHWFAFWFSLAAVSPSMTLLEEVRDQLQGPVWINADILPGPRGTAAPLDPHVFLQEVVQKSENDVLSLGWTTGWDVDADNPGKNLTTLKVLYLLAIRSELYI